jgi:four helix bundle protein
VRISEQWAVESEPGQNRCRYLGSIMEKIRTYRDLEIWRRAMNLSRAVYRLTGLLPTEERFGISSQMRRAVVSVPSNIAEGQQKSTRSFINHLTIALGSIAELETQLLLTADLYPEAKQACDDSLNELAELGKMIRTLTKRLDS